MLYSVEEKSNLQTFYDDPTFGLNRHCMHKQLGFHLDCMHNMSVLL